MGLLDAVFNHASFYIITLFVERFSFLKEWFRQRLHVCVCVFSCLDLLFSKNSLFFIIFNKLKWIWGFISTKWLDLCSY